MFFKKEDTVESLTKECNKLYSDFSRVITLAHSKGYYEFKKLMDENFHTLRDIMAENNTEEARLTLLKSFKEQLKFFNEYSFSSEPHAIDSFTKKFFPYKEKMEALLKSDTAPSPKKPKI